MLRRKREITDELTGLDASEREVDFDGGPEADWEVSGGPVLYVEEGSDTPPDIVPDSLSELP